MSAPTGAPPLLFGHSFCTVPRDGECLRAISRTQSFYDSVRILYCYLCYLQVVHLLMPTCAHHLLHNVRAIGQPYAVAGGNGEAGNDIPRIERKI